VYFGRLQARNSAGTNIVDIVTSTTAANPEGPRIVEKFDDVVTSGGS
jgi:hypothetical protein